MTMAAIPLEDDPMAFEHVTIMVEEVVSAFATTPARLFVDATVGGGGHSSAILQRFPEARLVAIDRDEEALAAARERLALFGERVTFVHARFSEISQAMTELGIPKVDGLLADLGVSSPQLDHPERGMSFRHPGPIDMRMDQSSGETALELIERSSQDELANLIYDYGEERASRRIARCIKQALERGELSSTLDLRRAVVRATGPRRVGGVDPATRTFQALRIAVNSELEELDALLTGAHHVIAPFGVAAILSFHSLEDRKVKRAFLERSLWEKQSNKPLVANPEEQARNARSRSAKLRVARRLPDKLESANDSETEPANHRGS